MDKEKTCPVMGNPVGDLATAPSYEYKGTTYYFCCPPCKDSFKQDPEKYINNGPMRPMGHHHHHH